MANPVWSLTNKTIDNRGTKVNPVLTTVTSANPEGWETLKTYSDGYTLQYKIDPQGRVGYRSESTGRQYANLQQYADDLAGKNSTDFIQKEINNTKQYLTGILTTRTQNTIPSQPAPGQSGTQTPGTADPGPNSGISTTYEELNPSPITNELKDFGDKNDFTKLKPFLFYPENIGKTGQDRIIIRQIEYVPASIAEGTTLPQTINTLSNRDGQFTKGLGEVILPIPNEISETNTTGWGEDNLSAIAATLMGQAGKFAGEVASGRVVASLGTLKQAFTNNLGDPAVQSRLERYLVSNAAASILKLGNINVNPEAFLTRATGVAINPNLELLFNGPKLRQFGFSFKMTPRSEKEAKHIRSIIKFFKKGMAPRRSAQSNKTIFLGSPNVFKMEFQSGSGGELKSIGKIKTCALVSCGVNYTPDGFYAAFQDAAAGGSQPISVVLSLGFTELTPIFNDEYNTEDEDKLTSIGPEGFNFVVGPTDGAGNQSAPGNEQAGRQGPAIPQGLPNRRQ